MKKWLSALLLIILLLQALPVDALATIGKALTDEELDRAYALTGLAKGDGLPQWHDAQRQHERRAAGALAGGPAGHAAAQHRRRACARPLPAGRAEGVVSNGLHDIYTEPVLQPGAGDDPSGGGIAPGHELPAGAHSNGCQHDFRDAFTDAGR